MRFPKAHRELRASLEIGRGNAAAVVDDLEVVFAVVAEVDFDAGGSSVEAVLPELLDGGGEV